jgi:hypothetical protein
MKFDLGELLKAVGLPVGLVAVFAAVLMFFGIQLDQVLEIAGAMVGAQLLIALVINVLKTTGAVDDGTAGKWSAALNIALIVGVAATLGFKPDFDFGSLDAALKTFAEFAGLLIGLLLNVLGTQSMHVAMTDGLGIRAFSLSRGQ